jgi:hypothetical protein
MASVRLGTEAEAGGRYCPPRRASASTEDATSRCRRGAAGDTRIGSYARHRTLRVDLDEHCPDIGASGASEEDVARAHVEHAWHAAAGIPAVDVTTGLGAMLYVKQHARDVPLYGFCELSASNSLLLLLAARTWLGASAINAETRPDDLRRALLSDTPEDRLPINAQLAKAVGGFEQLTDSLAFLTRTAEAIAGLVVIVRSAIGARLPSSSAC